MSRGRFGKPTWQTQVRIEVPIKLKLDQYAIRHDISRNAAINELLAQALGRHDKDLRQWEEDTAS